MSARDELAEVIAAGYGTDESPCPYDHAPAIADAIIAAGYSNPKVLGYIVVDRGGVIVGTQHKHAESTEAFAAAWTKECKDAGIDWDYRVATITEATP